MNTPKITTWSIGALVAALLPMTALAMKGELDRPHVALHASVPDNLREQIQQALQRKDCTFVSGSWVNKFTRLHYRSDTIQDGRTELTGAEPQVNADQPAVAPESETEVNKEPNPDSDGHPQ